MVLPLVLVATCVALYHGAELVLRRLDPAGERRSLTAGGLLGWLEGLKLRCVGLLKGAGQVCVPRHC